MMQKEEQKNTSQENSEKAEKYAKTLPKRLKEWLKEEKKNRFLFCAVCVAVVVAIAGLCAFFYWLGGRQNRPDSDVKGQVSQKVERKDDVLLGEPVTKGAIQATGQAVSADAVTPESVQGETRDGQETSDSVKNDQDSSSSTKNASNSKNANKNDATKPAEQTPAQESAISGGYAGKLMVSGGRLCTASGTPIQLRGVSTHGLSWFPEYVNEQMFAELKSWGANVVRLAMYTAEYNGYCTGDDANRSKLKELIEKGVQYATNQDLYVIIDWHILSDGNPNTYKSQAIQFFAEMAQKYAENDHVLYEICNEPNGSVGWEDVKSYATDVIATIRERDADGVILVGSPTWSQDIDKVAASPITGYSNIMYTLHFYADTHRDSLRSKLSKAVAGGLPVFVSEFGICDASGNGSNNIGQANQWIALLNQYGISYVAWSLCNKAESASILSSGCSKVNTITENDLSESGHWLLNTLQGTTSLSSVSASVQTQDTSNQQQTQSGNAGSSVTDSSNASSQTSVDNQNPPQSVTQTKTPEQYAPQAAAGTEYTVVNSWQEGNALCIQYEIKVLNTGNAVIDGWNGAMTFPADVTLVSGWNANFSTNANRLEFCAMDYNKTVQPGGRAEGIGCIIKID